jgi:hypothetical protein
MTTPTPSNLKIQTAEYMLSTTAGLAPRMNWFPRILTQSFLQSTKDGPIQISPSPVTMISGNMTWYNASPDPEYVWVLVHRAPRAITAQDPSCVIITDGWSFQVGANPQATTPAYTDDWFGGKLMIDRPDTDAADLTYARYFLEGDDLVAYVPVGIVPAGQSFEFLYQAAVQTPGAFTTPTAFTGEWSAYAYWTRLVALGSPVPSAGAVLASTGVITPGSQSFTTVGVYNTPPWANYLSIVALGAGGSGEGEIGVDEGVGGFAGEWNAVTLIAGVDFTPLQTVFIVQPGVGGAGQTFYFENGTAGTESLVTWTDPNNNPRSLIAAGGTGGSPGARYGLNAVAGQGVSPNPFSFNGIDYYGADESIQGLSASGSGGGGGGAVIFEPVTGSGGGGQVWFQAMQTLPEGYQTFATPGTYIAPSWTNYLDIVGLGAGGSGEGEILVNMGQGGAAGEWNAITLQAGEYNDFIPGVTKFTVTPGVAGAALVGYFGNGNAGTASTVTWTDPTGHSRSFTAAGGAGGGATGLFDYNGATPSPNPYTYNGVPYYGGTGGTLGEDANFPGSGGGGAFILEAVTGAGAGGEVWITARQT